MALMEVKNMDGFASRLTGLNLVSEKDGNKFYINPGIDMTQIDDSMQINSETVIAALVTPKKFVTLEVRGDVKVFFNEKVKDDPNAVAEDGDYYENPSEFPQLLKDIISGKEPIYRRDGDTKGYENMWTLDDRIYLSENNWFEVFVSDDEFDAFPRCDLGDFEHNTNDQIYESLLYAAEEDDE